MADTRIKVAKDKAQLVKALTASDETTGPFQTYADVVAFAAAVGAKYNRAVPLTGETSKSEPAPIHREAMSTRGHDALINLLALVDTTDPKVLASEEISDEKRIKIFEKYVNGGLEVIEEKLKGAVDYLEQIILLLSLEKVDGTVNDEFDLTYFLKET